MYWNFSNMKKWKIHDEYYFNLMISCVFPPKLRQVWLCKWRILYSFSFGFYDNTEFHSMIFFEKCEIALQSQCEKDFRAGIDLFDWLIDLIWLFVWWAYWMLADCVDKTEIYLGSFRNSQLHLFDNGQLQENFVPNVDGTHFCFSLELVMKARNSLKFRILISQMKHWNVM